MDTVSLLAQIEQKDKCIAELKSQLAEAVKALESAKVAFDWEKKTEPRVAIPNNADQDVEETLSRLGVEEK